MPATILLMAAKSGVHLYLKDNNLAYKTTGQGLTPELKQLITDNKNGIMELLKSQQVYIRLPALKRLDNKPEQVLASYAQQGLWLSDQFLGGGPEYNISGIINFSGNLDIKTLKDVFIAIINRHESLRTVFRVNDKGELYQLVRNHIDFSLIVTEIKSSSEQESRSMIDLIKSSEALKTFDLDRDLMLRAQVIIISPNKYMLLITMHHIASDGWSLSILIKELSELYNAQLAGLPNKLSPLSIQYSDYAHWQRSLSSQDELNQQLQYWVYQLHDVELLHNFPLDKPRPLIKTSNGGIHTSFIKGKLFDAISQLCVSCDATLFMGIHAAFAVLIARYSNQTQVSIGTPSANRDQVEISNLIGFFVNTLVLRSNLFADSSFTQVISQSKKTVIDAFRHQNVPFEMVVEKLNPPRSLAYSPIFQIMLAYQNNEQSELSMQGIEVDSVEQNGVFARYDLTLNVRECRDGLQLDWEYSTDLFYSESIIKLSNNFNKVLTTLLADPKTSIFEIDLVDDNDKQKLLNNWSGYSYKYPDNNCIQELFEAKANKFPHATAVIFSGTALSYGDLNSKANQLAHYLRQVIKVKPPTLIGICLDRSFDMIVALLAVLKAGAAYLPLDPKYPLARLKYMVKDANLGAVITSTSCPLDLSQDACIIPVDDSEVVRCLQMLPSVNIPKESIDLSAADAAFAVYTSGSTGKPKASLLKHSGLCNLAIAQANAFSISNNSRVLQFASFSFDAATAEIFATLLGGACIVLMKVENTKSPAAVSRIINEHDITHVTLPPAVLSEMDCILYNKLEVIIVAGDKCPIQLAKQWGSRYRLINAYGPSETTVCATIGEYSHANNVFPIGKPIHNVFIYLLDSHKNLVPPGSVGEIYIGGAGVGLGYLFRPELNREKFIESPFKNQNNKAEQLYSTGDFARWLGDGSLEYIGRRDQQIKIRGFRIELGEIEEALLSYSDVDDAVVLVNDDGFIVAYLTFKNPVELDYQSPLLDKIKSHVEKILLDYMVPHFFAFLKKFPLTENGKVDKRSLLKDAGLIFRKPHIEPTTEFEKDLCIMSAKFLNIEKVGIEDNFFNLGGHSLLATKLIASINEYYKINMSINAFFKEKNFKDLAASVENLVVINGNNLLKEHTKLNKELEW